MSPVTAGSPLTTALLRSIIASFHPFLGLVQTVVLPIKVDTVKNVLKVIYTGNLTLPSKAHVEQVLSGLELFNIHLPGLQFYISNDIEPPFSHINKSSPRYATTQQTIRNRARC